MLSSLRLDRLRWHSVGLILLAIGVALSVFRLPGQVRSSGLERWIALGPDYASASTVVFSPHNPQTVFVGTSGNGVFKSTDQGATWQASSEGLPPSLWVENIVFHPTEANTIYIGTSYGTTGRVYKSTNGGASWSNSSSGLTITRVVGLDIDPNTPANLYLVGNTSGGVGTAYRSTNGGASWSESRGNLPGDKNTMNTVVVDPKDGKYVYAGATNGLFRSENSGANWSLITSNAVTWISAVPTASGVRLYANMGGKVFKSDNRGGSWDQIQPNVNDLDVLHGAVSPSNPNTVYVAGRAGVFKSENGGSSWTPVQSGIENEISDLIAMAIHPSNTNILFYSAGNLFKTTNGGSAWSPSYKGITSSEITAIAVESKATPTLYAATWDGIYKSSNGGSSWTFHQVGQSPNKVVNVLIDPGNSSTIYAGTFKGMYKSVDGGVNWSSAANGMSTQSPAITVLEAGPASSNTIYAGTSRKLYKSVNSGESWTEVSLGQGVDHSILALGVHPSDANTLYVSAMALSNGARVLLKSANGGTSWSSVISGLESTLIKSLIVDPATPTTVYAVTDSKGVYKTTNAGSSWSASNSGLTELKGRTMSVDTATNPVTLYVGTNAGVFRSSNAGASWTKLPEAGLTSTSINGISINSAATPPQAYLATSSGGVFEGQFEDNTLPVVDLNGPVAGIDYFAELKAFADTASPVSVVDKDRLTVSAPEGTLQSATVTLTNRPDGDDERLDANVGNTGITKNYNSSTGVLTLTGPATAAQFQQVLRTVTYRNSADEPDPEARIITFVVTDGTLSSATATATLMVVSDRLYLPLISKD